MLKEAVNQKISFTEQETAFLLCVCMVPTKRSCDEDNKFTGSVSPEYFQSQPLLKGHHDLSSTFLGLCQNS